MNYDHNRIFDFQERIGSVDFFASQKSIDEKRYSDGSVENRMLEFFQKNPTEEDISRALRGNLVWAEYYHYTPIRRNLLEWYEFKKESSLLEVGAGAGALTGLFCERLQSVTAVELTFRRAQITAHRHKRHKNLSVIAGDVHTLPGSETFDYISLIGVLEYAGVLSESDNPFIELLDILYKRLNRGGILIIAIENKFGLKYWAGCREDHTNHLFESIEGYPEQKQKQTFSKKELQSMLTMSGYCSVDFYYPLPDYKLPTEIFSDNYLPSATHFPQSSHYPFVDYSTKEREELFNQENVMQEIIKNNQFDFFANSFLIFAQKN